jgi:hypothetical protein
MKFVLMMIPLILIGMIGIEQSFADVEYSHEFNLENCEGVLEVEEIKSTINRIEEITVNSRSLMAVDEQPNLLSICDSTFESQGKSISMSIVVMDSSEAANSLYQQNLDSFSEQGMDFRQYATFWNNFDVTINDQNVGSFMISQYDQFFINIHTSFEGDGPALINADEIRMLSTIVQKKILDLDDVSISPPNPLPTPNLDDPDRFTDEHGIPPIETGRIDSPKKQISQGIKPAAVICNEGLVLIAKKGGESSACVKPITADILYERGWGDMPPSCCKPTTVSSATNFEECIAEGNPAMESYPRQCRTSDGKHFVESIPEHKKCEMTGGLWGAWSNSVPVKESCNLPTSDEGMSCTDSSQCQSFCQANEGSEINSEGTGTCYGYELAICMQEVRNDVVQNEWCQ